jgi:thiamine biosynthesis lipoprotein
MSIEQGRRVALSGPTMGTRWSSVCYLPAGCSAAAAEVGLARAVATVDAQMSTWKPHTALMQLNRAPIGDWCAVPDELMHVLSAALEIGTASGGLFDVSVLPHVQAWGFGPSGTPARTPPPARPLGAPIELDPHGRARRMLDVGLDLSGIAKGFAVDLMARALEQLGIVDFLVSIDGEVQGAGCHPDGRPWQVGLEAPDFERRGVLGAIALADCALATSGDYRHRRAHGAGWVSHTIDPRTGQPANNRLASVTVRMTQCMPADAWATALLVAGETEGPRLAAARQLDAIFLLREAGALTTIGTGSFQ